MDHSEHAGHTMKKTLKLVAQYADACNLFADPALIKGKLDILKSHCDTVGRDYKTIEITAIDTVHLAPGKMSAKDIIDKCKVLADVGVHHTIFNLPHVHEIKPLDVFGREIIPAVAGF